MSVRSRFNIPIPSTDLLTYIFDSPWKETQGWAPDEPLVLSSKGQSSCTFNQLKHLVKCFASGFQRLAGPGRRVLIYGGLDVYLPVAMLGAIGAEAVCNLDNERPAAETLCRMKAAEADYIFFPASQMDSVCAAARETNFPVENLFILDGSLTGESQSSVRHWSCLLDYEDGPGFEWRRLTPEEAKTTTVLYSHTSGTTGFPKIAERTHYGLIGNTEQLLYRYHLKERDAREIFFCVFHIFGIGWILYGLLIPLKARYQTIYMAKYDVNEFIQAVDTFKPTSLHTPRYVFQQLLAHARDADFSSVTSIRTGGAMIPFWMCEEWRNRHGSPCEVVCGMTEGGIHFSSDPREPETDHTVGELLPNLEGKVVDKAGQPVGRGECGEVWIKNPFVMKGYLRKGGETDLVVTPDGWIKTGDVGMVNERNRWYIIGRMKDMFKLNGTQVTASEIEAAITIHSEITEASVVPTKLVGEDAEEPLPRGYIVRKSGSNLTMDEFMAWMARDFSIKVQLFGGAVFVDFLPLSSAGKIDRNALRERAVKEIALLQKPSTLCTEHSKPGLHESLATHAEEKIRGQP